MIQPIQYLRRQSGKVVSKLIDISCAVDEGLEVWICSGEGEMVVLKKAVEVSCGGGGVIQSISVLFLPIKN